MLKRTGLCLLLGVVGAAPACGSPSDNNFGGPATAGSAMKGGASGSAGAQAKGGASGDSGASGKGGTATGGADGGGSGGSGGSIGGSGAPDMGGTGMGGSATQGGSSGDAATGGTGMATGGTEPGTGGTGMTTGGMGGMPPMGGRPGRGGNGGSGGKVNCDELVQQYADALAAARACNAKSGKEQCTETASSSLTCGCDVPVNPDNTDAIDELTRLKKAGAGCSMVCPAIACIAPGPGVCAVDPDSPGLCTSGGAILQ